MNLMWQPDGQNSSGTRATGNGEKGQSILIVAAGLVVLMLAAGLAIDMGYLRYEKRRAQMAADSAAIAGAAAYEACVQGDQCTDMVTAGQTSAAYNGFDVSNPQVSVAIQNPPSTGAYVGNANYVEAIVTQNTPVYFMRILGPSTTSYTISASAVAYPGPGVGCIYALDSLTLSGSGQDDASVQSGQCLLLDSGALNVGYDSYAWDTGGAVYGGTATGVATSDPNLYPPPVPGAPVGNPLSYLKSFTASGVGSCTAGVCTPGDYPNGITIQGDWTFQPGLYSVEGSGLNISGYGGEAVTGNGVTFSINHGGVSINSGATYAPCTLSSPGVTVQFVAPSDGTYTGVLFIGSQNLSGTSSFITLNNGDSCNVPGVTSPTSNWFPSTNSSYAWGVIDFPAGSLTLNGIGLFSSTFKADGNSVPVVGCSDTPRFTTVIAYDLTLDGTDNFGVGDCNAITPYTFPFPDLIKDAVLVE
jgi:Putative Flp pilus-assembly TadE/G-like